MTRSASLPFEPAAGRRRRPVGVNGAPLPAPAARVALVEPISSEATVDVAMEASCGWRGFREGALEVLGTLLATLAFGLSWAAFEAGRLDGELVSQEAMRAKTADAAAARAVAPPSGYARAGSVGG